MSTHVKCNPVIIDDTAVQLLLGDIADEPACYLNRADNPCEEKAYIGQGQNHSRIKGSHWEADVTPHMANVTSAHGLVRWQQALSDLHAV